ncbi:MAG: class B sortase [Lachnospiraceae bacterium]|nr:class B sortase [Lachnospiraceae bacterium]
MNKKKSSKKSRKPISLSLDRRQKRRLIALGEGVALGRCICLVIFCAWKLVTIISEYGSGSKEYNRLEQYVLSKAEDPDEAGSSDAADTDADTETDSSYEDTEVMQRIDFASLQEINNEAVGWIEIPDTKISYPLVHTTDNSWYLTHTFSGDENTSGSIFIETANSADFTDLHTIIYGHNMKNGSMFGTLKKYKKQSYYESHPYIYIDLEDGTHCYQIFSCHEAETTDISYTIGYAQDDIYQAFLDELVAASLYDTGVSVSTSDSVITLSTCTSNGTARFVVHAKKLY